MSSVPRLARDEHDDVKALPQLPSASSRVLPFSPRLSHAQQLLLQLEAADPRAVSYVVTVLVRLLGRVRVFK